MELGFADEVGSTKKARAAVANSFDLRMFRNVPEQLKDEPKPGHAVPFPEVVPDGSPLVTPTEPKQEPPTPAEDYRLDIFRKRLGMLKRSA